MEGIQTNERKSNSQCWWGVEGENW